MISKKFRARLSSIVPVFKIIFLTFTMDLIFFFLVQSL
jgi:hypothetical protein